MQREGGVRQRMRELATKIATEPCLVESPTLITHDLFCLMRIFQCLAVPRQLLKLLETLDIRVLKRLASAVQLRPCRHHSEELSGNLTTALPRCLFREWPHRAGHSCRQRQAGMPQGRRVLPGLARGREGREPLGG
jgi:hypothetical protein